MTENHFADDTPVNTSELASAMRFSRWTVYRHKQDGYEFEFGCRTTPGHYKQWLRQQSAIKAERKAAAKQIKPDEDRISTS